MHLAASSVGTALAQRATTELSKYIMTKTDGTVTKADVSGLMSTLGTLAATGQYEAMPGAVMSTALDKGITAIKSVKPQDVARTMKKMGRALKALKRRFNNRAMAPHVSTVIDLIKLTEHVSLVTSIVTGRVPKFSGDIISGEAACKLIDDLQDELRRSVNNKGAIENVIKTFEDDNLVLSTRVLDVFDTYVSPPSTRYSNEYRDVNDEHQRYSDYVTARDALEVMGRRMTLKGSGLTIPFTNTFIASRFIGYDTAVDSGNYVDGGSNLTSSDSSKFTSYLAEQWALSDEEAFLEFKQSQPTTAINTRVPNKLVKSNSIYDSATHGWTVKGVNESSYIDMYVAGGSTPFQVVTPFFGPTSSSADIITRREAGDFRISFRISGTLFGEDASGSMTPISEDWANVTRSAVCYVVPLIGIGSNQWKLGGPPQELLITDGSTSSTGVDIALGSIEIVLENNDYMPTFMLIAPPGLGFGGAPSVTVNSELTNAGAAAHTHAASVEWHIGTAVDGVIAGWLSDNPSNTEVSYYEDQEWTASNETLVEAMMTASQKRPAGAYPFGTLYAQLGLDVLHPIHNEWSRVNKYIEKIDSSLSATSVWEYVRLLTAANVSPSKTLEAHRSLTQKIRGFEQMFVGSVDAS